MLIKAEVVERNGLTPREVEIFAMVCEGAVDKVIARRLAIGIKTVEMHMTHIYTKMELREASINRRCAAISRAVATGMVRLSSSALCLCLAVAAANYDDEALRPARIRHVHHTVRVRNREA